MVCYLMSLTSRFFIVLPTCMYPKKKNQSKTIKCITLGYDDKSKVYRLFFFEKKIIKLSKNVVFDKIQISLQHPKNDSSPPNELVFLPPKNDLSDEPETPLETLQIYLLRKLISLNPNWIHCRQISYLKKNMVFNPNLKIEDRVRTR